MTRPVFLITLGAVAGMIAAVGANAGLGAEVADRVLNIAAGYMRMAPRLSPFQLEQTSADDGAAATHSIFSTCLKSAGGDLEATLRNLLEFHEHDATLNLVECLVGSEPQRFCGPSGRQQVADAMEIYYWSREDARRTSPAHGLADKIHWLDRAAQSNQPAAAEADPFALTWSGPRDRALFDKLRDLARLGYLEPEAFAYSGRAELREALHDVKPEASPCSATAGR